ncbi:hypothetical protein D3C78_1330960 [compost metagenome]
MLNKLFFSLYCWLVWLPAAAGSELSVAPESLASLARLSVYLILLKPYPHRSMIYPKCAGYLNFWIPLSLRRAAGLS